MMLELAIGIVTVFMLVIVIGQWNGRGDDDE